MTRAYEKSMSPLIGTEYAAKSGRAFDQMRIALAIVFGLVVLGIVATLSGTMLLAESSALDGWICSEILAMAYFVVRYTLWFSVWRQLGGELRESDLKFRRTPDLRGPTFLGNWARLERVRLEDVTAAIQAVDTASNDTDHNVV